LRANCAALEALLPLEKLRLAHLPTPLFRSAALDRIIGGEVWVKRDDMTGGAEAGNKIRKLEYLLAAAWKTRAQVVITCGGVQSNHARATAILARRLGMRPLLFLRTRDGQAPTERKGNLLLDALVGAELRFITPAQYMQRDLLMQEAARTIERDGEAAYVIPEGGSNGLGALGYVDAMAEVRAQLDAGDGGGPAPFDAVVHACGSGGTAAGVCIGAALHRVATQAIAMAVCDDSAYFEQRIAQIMDEATQALQASVPRAQSIVLDQWKGPAYAVPSAEQARFIVQIARETGLLMDPVYTGKALFGLAQLTPKPKRVLFLHTGGLPGLLADPTLFDNML
jgi:D-cysteine desulfhydrase